MYMRTWEGSSSYIQECPVTLKTEKKWLVPGQHISRLLLQVALDGGTLAECGVRSLHFDPIICGWTGRHWSRAGGRVGSCRAWNCVHMWGWTSRSWRWGLSISLQNWKLLEFLRGLGFHTPAPLLPSDCCYPLSSSELGHGGLCSQWLVRGTTCFLCIHLALLSTKMVYRWEQYFME